MHKVAFAQGVGWVVDHAVGRLQALVDDQAFARHHRHRRGHLRLRTVTDHGAHAGSGFDHVVAILVRRAREVNGRFFIDETVLREAGMTDFSGYAVDPSRALLPDFFLDDPELEEALRR